MQLSLLTDAICAALLGFAALWLVQANLQPSRIALVAAGFALAGAMLLREATMFIAVVGYGRNRATKMARYWDSLSRTAVLYSVTARAACAII
jgi:hypothetical protein